MYTKELREGINGSGHTMWMVVSVDADGNWKHIEYFDSKAEALCWLQYA